MPATLPGLYWDETRNRYFPLSSKPKVKEEISNQKTQLAEPRNIVTPGYHYVPLHSSSLRLRQPEYTRALRDSHQNICYHFAQTSKKEDFHLPAFGNVTALNIHSVHEQLLHLVGDDQGWVYTGRESPQSTERFAWSSDFNMSPSSPVSYLPICLTLNLRSATCLGQGKIYYRDIGFPERTITINLSNGVNDIRAADLHGDEVVLGCKTKLVYLPDINATRSPRHLKMKSDVFSISRRHYSIYAGCRNGSIERFDLRESSHSQILFDSRFDQQPRSSVLHLKCLRDNELLVCHQNGELVSFDLRFLASNAKNPLQTFEGHVNSYLPTLGLAIDSYQNFLFAAGQDRRVRGWSLRNGIQLYPSPTLARAEASTNPFSTVFPSPVTALQMVESHGSDGISLWAAYDRDLSQFHLGQQDHPS
ncbi:hypothetical protein CPB83DRAFT_774106 [Crepidotus variabilis]|uniref:WD40 repeat-like protein n=1 Tax=Crepidotus variabilis TaxID=179855 RepID=A0A9P6JKI6_9AGAR|nr:hypothetical protein CPB83DRAFT_774106 [Crepidotus variabilis]